ncbi:MAG: hypothetical protein R3202_14240, partial [Candidatus Competibacterales bacterium]|nr:hypothetical protein [Candidatus Competibacterales bacterium]
DTGLAAALAAGRFGHFAGRNRMCEVERAMGVWFVSHELSDAVTVSRLHEGPDDGAILVLPAFLFEAERQRRAAAVLAVGDSGIVFRYPLLARPLMIDEPALIVVPQADRQWPQALRPRIRVVEPGPRPEFETRLRACLQQAGFTPAVPAASGLRP